MVSSHGRKRRRRNARDLRRQTGRLFQAAGIDHTTKSKIEFGVAGQSGWFDEIKVWSVEPVKWSTISEAEDGRIPEVGLQIQTGPTQLVRVEQPAWPFSVATCRRVERTIPAH